MADETTDTRPVVLSGIQPSGQLHIGNYIGALSQWVDNQRRFRNTIFIADLHALTSPGAIAPAELRDKTREIAGLYIAAGIDPDDSLIFRQSDVPAHPYLGWILGCCTPIGWLQRMTQYKTKAAADRERESSGLLTYPVLQAADILAYHPKYVPVGEDQKQHVELTREIARRFNVLYGDVFTIPELMMRKAGARIMGLDDPEAKMSKSSTAPGHAIGVLQPMKRIRKTIMGAKTDSGSEVKVAEAGPGVRNLLTIYQELTGKSDEQVAAELDGKQYGHLKLAVFSAVEEVLTPIQERYHQIADDPGVIEGLLERGAKRASEVAEATLAKVRQAVGVG